MTDARVIVGHGSLRRAAWGVAAVAVGLSAVMLLALRVGEGRLGAPEVVFALCLGGGFALLHVVTALIPWYLRGGGVEVIVAGGTLEVVRRGRHLYACRVSDILRVEVRGTPSWSALNPAQGVAGERFPQLVLRTRGGSWASPGLPVWKGEERRLAAQVQQAVADERSRVGEQ